MQVLSVNTGVRRPFANKMGATGIFKTPRSGPVAIGELGLGGDHIADSENHGGRDQAVYIYGQPDYDWWVEQLGETLAPGTFGENLTLAGFESAKACIGDRFIIGDVVLEITSPRIPCATLAARMGDSGFVKRFHRAGRPGVYCRVITTGEVSAGDAVELIPFEGTRIAITDLMEDYKNPSLERMRYLMQTPVHRKLVALYEERLRRT